MGPFLIQLIMTKELREAYLRENINRVSIGTAAYVTGLHRETIRRKWGIMRDSLGPEELPPPPKELDTDVAYVFIPALKARVRLKKGVTPEMYMARVVGDRIATNFNQGARKEKKV